MTNFSTKTTQMLCNFLDWFRKLPCFIKTCCGYFWANLVPHPVTIVLTRHITKYLYLKEDFSMSPPGQIHDKQNYLENLFTPDRII